MAKYFPRIMYSWRDPRLQEMTTTGRLVNGLGRAAMVIVWFFIILQIMARLSSFTELLAVTLAAISIIYVSYLFDEYCFRQWSFAAQKRKTDKLVADTTAAALAKHKK